ncbi:hypothetical protein SAMN05421747_13711 [Parapedobacter composti]|uniref:Uncharacterized protein n=1 Tax=Parapedobacter composti TaxID=623281 RepID=A0A1I1MHE6_9SPHI|nr:hypothetical protein SAMN05421747_13711 [Parapedobacter composti]
MRTVWLKLSIFAPKKLYGGRTVNRSEIPHYAYTWPLAARLNDRTVRHLKKPTNDCHTRSEQSIADF